MTNELIKLADSIAACNKKCHGGYKITLAYAVITGRKLRVLKDSCQHREYQKALKDRGIALETARMYRAVADKVWPELTAPSSRLYKLLVDEPKLLTNGESQTGVVRHENGGVIVQDINIPATGELPEAVIEIISDYAKQLQANTLVELQRSLGLRPELPKKYTPPDKRLTPEERDRIYTQREAEEKIDLFVSGVFAMKSIPERARGVVPRAKWETVKQDAMEALNMARDILCVKSGRRSPKPTPRERFISEEALEILPRKYDRNKVKEFDKSLKSEKAARHLKAPLR